MNKSRKFKRFYWVCMSEKLIYHSLPLFGTNAQKAIMKKNGITNQETYTKTPLSTVLMYCRMVKPHYIYSEFTTAEFKPLDCPELKEYQLLHNLEGRYIDESKGRLLNEGIEEEFTDEIYIDNEIIDIIP